LGQSVAIPCRLDDKRQLRWWHMGSCGGGTREKSPRRQWGEAPDNGTDVRRGQLGLGGGQCPVRVDGRDEGGGDVGQLESAGHREHLGPVGVGQLPVQPSQPRPQRGREVGGGDAHRDLLEQLRQRDGGGLLQRGGLVELGLGDPDRVDDDEVGLDLRVGVTAWKSASLMTRTPRPFICSKKLRDFTPRRKNTHSSGLSRCRWRSCQRSRRCAGCRRCGTRRAALPVCGRWSGR